MTEDRFWYSANVDPFSRTSSSPSARWRHKRRRAVYKFVNRFTANTGREMYCWEARIPGDSRVDRVTCPVEWFWSKPDTCDELFIGDGNDSRLVQPVKRPHREEGITF